MDQLTPSQLHVRRRLLEIVCSDPWLETCCTAIAQFPSAARRPDKHLDQTRVYPPGGHQHTRMRHCTGCGKRWYPPQYIMQEICLDCAAGSEVPLTDEQTHISTTSSPTSIALRQMELYHVRLIEPRLAAEDEASLRRQIAAFTQDKKTPLARKEPRNVEVTPPI